MFSLNNQRIQINIDKYECLHFKFPGVEKHAQYQQKEKNTSANERFCES